MEVIRSIEMAAADLGLTVAGVIARAMASLAKAGVANLSRHGLIDELEAVKDNMVESIAKHRCLPAGALNKLANLKLKLAAVALDEVANHHQYTADLLFARTEIDQLMRTLTSLKGSVDVDALTRSMDEFGLLITSVDNYLTLKGRELS